MRVPLRLACAAAAALLAAAPAAAQTGQVALPAAPGPVATGACGQPLTATFRFAAPVDATPAEPFVARIARHEPVYLEFALSAGSRVALRTRDSGADPYLVLYDTTGPVTANDDGGGNSDALIDLTLAPGTYCAQVRLYGGGMAPETFVTLDLATGEAAAALASAARGGGGGGRADGLPAPCADPALVEDIGAVGPGLGLLEFAGSLAEGSAADWTFSVTDPVTLQLEARSTAFDTMLDLADAAGGFVQSNDDGPNGTDSRIVAELEPGEWCLRVTSYGGTGGDFTLALSDEPEAGPPEGGDSGYCADPARTRDLVTPAPIGTGLGTFTVAGQVAPNGFQDWRMPVASATAVQIDVRSPEFDTMLDLADGAGSYLDGNDDGPSGTDSRLVTELAAGSYCLRVRGYGGSGGAYEIALTDSPEEGGYGEPAPLPCADPASTADLGRIVAPGFGILRIPGRLAPGARQDWWMTVEGTTTLQIDATSRDFDTVLALHTDSGAFVAENDDADSGTDSRLTETLTPGVYCLSLRSWGDYGTGAYEVALTEQDEATLRRAAIEAGEMAPGPDSGVEVEDLGTLATTLQTQRLSQERTKWVAFTLAEGGLVQVQSSSLIGAFTLRLFDAAGQKLAEADSSGVPNAASLYRELAPGRYLVGMTLAPGAGGRINLRQVVLNRFVRP